MDLIYLFYGLAFLALGFVIVIRLEPASTFHLARHLWLLAAFGFVHGLLEWTDLWRVMHGDTAALATLRPFILLASFVLLLEFGRRLTLAALVDLERHAAVQRLLGPWMHLPIYAAVVLAVAVSEDRLAALALWSRYLPGFLGATLAGAGCYLYRRRRFAADERSAAGSVAWYVAAAAFFAYGVLAGVVAAPGTAFPSSVINEETFLFATAIPVQALRAICAVLIAASVARIMGMFDEERASKLRHAVDAGQYSLAQYHEVKARYEAIMDASPEGIVGLDADGNFSFANRAALSMLGFGIDELKGKSFHVVAHHTLPDGSLHPLEECLIHKTLMDGKPRHADADVFWRSNRTWFPAVYQVARVQRGDKVFGVVVILRNLADPH
jgi:PAS domain S-box-containing protein